jgi:glycerol-3-phosphate O-acyltransferase
MATVFVRHAGRGLAELDLKAEVAQLVRTLEAGGAHIYVPRGDFDYALTVGLRMLRLRKLVEDRDGIYQIRPSELPLLQYYAHSIGHLFPAQR